MLKERVKVYDEEYVHGSFFGDYAICGLSLSEDPELGIGEGIIVTDRIKIDCPQCLDLIKECKILKKGIDY